MATSSSASALGSKRIGVISALPGTSTASMFSTTTKPLDFHQNQIPPHRSLQQTTQHHHQLGMPVATSSAAGIDPIPTIRGATGNYDKPTASSVTVVSNPERISQLRQQTAYTRNEGLDNNRTRISSSSSSSSSSRNNDNNNNNSNNNNPTTSNSATSATSTNNNNNNNNANPTLIITQNKIRPK